MRYAIALAVLISGVAAGQELPKRRKDRKTLTVKQAQDLVKQGDPVSLDQLAWLSVDVAKALAEHKDLLWLNGLTTLSDEAARALTRHNGWVQLNRLTTLSVEAAAALRASVWVKLPERFRR